MGPLTGFRIVELSGLGPGPYCGMLLADLGADVICVERTQGTENPFSLPPEVNLVNRGKRSIALDLKNPEGTAVLLRLVATADAFIEGFRPGVAERLGVGPEDCAKLNPRLVYGRLTGYGQHGPLAAVAGHDINYIAVAGALSTIGRADATPVPPLNFLGDYAGGSLFLAVGVLAALLERTRSGRGQVVDAAMTDGVSSMLAPLLSLVAGNAWSFQRGTNLFDTGTPFYDVYRTSDGGFVAVGALEPKFFKNMAERVGLDLRFLALQYDRSCWPDMHAELTQIFRTKSRMQWQDLLEGTDCCVSPVLNIDEAHLHPHNHVREAFRVDGDRVEPAPAPRFSRSAAEWPAKPPVPGQFTADILRTAGYDADAIGRLLAAGVAV